MDDAPPDRMTARDHHLGAMTSDEMAGTAATLLVPLGATEQHGPHLPLETDTVVATAWARAVAEELNDGGHPAVVAPALPYGSSGEHQSFPGTLSIGADALRTVIVELTRSAASTFARVVYLSGHAGNLGPVGDAVARLTVEGHDVTHLVPSWSPERGWVVDAHAGRTETALMLALQPDTVRLDRAEAGNTEPLGTIMTRMIADGIEAVSANGVLGDPSGADGREGLALLADLVDRTVQHLR